MRKILVIAALVALPITIALQIQQQVRCDYTEEQKYGQFWHLAEKASTLSEKRVLIREFLNAMRDGYAKGEFASNDAVWLKTPNNSMQSNLHALSTLADRLDQISELDPSSFQYATSIEQITKQEQGEANDMLSVFDGCYALAEYPFTWGWISGSVLAAEIAIGCALFVVLLVAAAE